MTVLSDLIAEINANIPTGVNHQITAAKVRTVLTDMATSIYTSIGSGTGGGGGSGATGVSERYLTSSTTASPGDICYCSTVAGGFTVTLPANPVPGTGVGFRDAESSWSAANLTVFPGTNAIEGTTGNFICDVTNANFDLIWGGATSGGWQLVVASTFATSGAGTGTGAAGATYFHATSNLTAQIGATYYADTVGSGFTVTLPTGPGIGAGISFKDASGTWNIHNLILDPGSLPINGTVSPLSVDQQDIDFDLVWRGLPMGWQVEIPVYKAARGGLIASTGFLTTKPLGALGQAATATRGSGITWNAADKSANITLSNGNLTATDATAAGGVRGTTSGATGRYFEVTWSTAAGSAGVGLANLSQSLTAYPGNPNAIGFFASGYVEWPGSGTGNTTGVVWGAGDVIGVLQGASNAQLFKNGALIYTATALPSGALYPFLWQDPGHTATVNFGATAMSFLPTGATSWDGTRTSAGAATWSPTDQFGLTLSNGNLSATISSGSGQGRANRSNGANHYFEVNVDTSVAGSIYIGLANASQTLSSGYAGNPNGISYWNNSYAEWPGGSSVSVGTYGAGANVGVWLKASTAEFYLNGTLQFTASLPSGALYPIVGIYNTGASVTANFGATSFAHLPSGAIGWNS